MNNVFRAAPAARLSACLFAQDPNPSDSVAVFCTRVQLVTVPVVVRDKSGRAVEDLKKEDFELRDKGKPQIISRFSIQKPTDQLAVTVSSPAEPDAQSARLADSASASPIPTRFVAYLFDDLHTEQFDLNSGRDAAEKQMRDGLRSPGRAAIFTTSGQGMPGFHQR